VEKERIIGGATIREGDAVLGLASSGAHSNGYSLIRKIVENSGADLGADFHGRPLGEVLLTPTRIYVKPLLALMEQLPLKGMAHITGGGLLDNIPRILRPELTALLDADSWTPPPVFDWLREQGNVPPQEMYRTFNCGVGMAVIVAPEDETRAIGLLRAAGEQVWRIGGIAKRSEGQPQTVIR
jgi:phosphoribosylformylglycinamidine cyclo-ligase